MTVRRRSQSILHLWFHFLSTVSFIAVLLVLGACSKKENLSKSCSVAADQAGSFMGRVSGFPLHLTVDDQFSDVERNSISATVSEWNQQGQGFVGGDLFSIEYKALPAAIRTTDPHACGAELGGAQDLFVVRELNQDHWKSIGFEKNTPGATIRCYDSDQVSRQIIFMNPTLMNAHQFDQAFAHEFGHSLGLDHSCNDHGSADNYLSCDAVKDDHAHPYYQAVMYYMLKNSSAPAVASTTTARTSAVLSANDQSRGNCITGAP